MTACQNTFLFGITDVNIRRNAKIQRHISAPAPENPFSIQEKLNSRDSEQIQIDPWHKFMKQELPRYIPEGYLRSPATATRKPKLTNVLS
jgi:hypothetical protein